MVCRWATAAFLDTEKSFRKIMGYKDLWMLDGPRPQQQRLPSTMLCRRPTNPQLRLGHSQLEARTSLRGGFTLRVPVANGPYVVTAEAKGFESQQKTVEVYESQKTTVMFQLTSAKKKKKKMGIRLTQVTPISCGFGIFLGSVTG